MLANESVAGPARAIATTDRSSAVIAALCAAVLGLFIIWGVGFSHASVLHNAGHDMRHSNAFPCH
jgi:cobalt transporter subunit CbtB